VTISAQTNAGTPSNQLSSLAFGAATNALIDIGGQVGATGNFTVSLPPGTAQTSFAVRQAAPGYTTVPLVVTDGCGDWSTFAGGGPGAYGALAPSSARPVPTMTATPAPAPARR